MIDPNSPFRIERDPDPRLMIVSSVIYTALFCAFGAYLTPGVMAIAFGCPW